MNNLMKRKDRIALFLFYLAYAIELGIMLVDKSALINPFEGKLFRLTFLLCVVKIMMTKYSYKEWGLICVFSALGAISYFATGRNEIIRIVMFVAASKGIDGKKLLQYTFYVTLAGVLLLMALSAFGILGWNYVEADFDGDGPQGIIRRYCFGLGHPNAFHCMFFCVVLLGIYIYLEQLKSSHEILILVLNFFFYYFTKSKTGVIIVTCTVLLAILYTYRKTFFYKKWVYVSSIIMIICCNIVSVIDAIYGWYLPAFKYIDRYLTGRFGSACEDGGFRFWSLFSNPSNEQFFDMGYIRMFYWYGIIPVIIYLLVVFLLIWNCYRKQDVAGFIVILALSAYTFVEAHTVSVYIARNYIFVLLFGCWNEVFHACSSKERYFYQIFRIHN